MSDAFRLVSEFQPTGDQERALEVVGVVSDSRIRDLLADPEPAVFGLFDDRTWPTTNALLIRTRGDATASMATSRPSTAA